MIKTAHLHLLTYPTATPSSVVRFAMDFCSKLGARANVSIARPLVHAPAHWFAGPVLAGIAETLRTQAEESAAVLEADVRKAAAEANVSAACQQVTYRFPTADDAHGWLGRTADISLIPMPASDDESRLVAEDWIFQSGHGTLLCPRDLSTCSLKTALVTWDFSRAASRAIADAMPLLRRAETVSVLTVRGEKHLPEMERRAPLLAYLEAHAVNARLMEVDLQDGSISKTIEGCADTLDAGLIVMGAYGHSRFQEFLLGGATKGMLAHARRPVLMSH